MASHGLPSVAVPGTTVAIPGIARKVAIPGSIPGGCSCGGQPFATAGALTGAFCGGELEASQGYEW